MSSKLLYNQICLLTFSSEGKVYGNYHFNRKNVGGRKSKKNPAEYRKKVSETDMVQIHEGDSGV